ncbi:Pycsar system effector family protein [Saccharopolyspora taberi]|uniref:Pycsar effector protein domain-containing protein n=1 Tax=Saccharopolyspora taberi TaxID=60895 RepID=A0ABN3V9H9_9PSEU
MAESTGGGPDVETVEGLLQDELARGDSTLTRTETKTSILLAVFSPILTVGLGVLPRASVPVVATVLFWAALALLAVAMLLLLWNVRPRLRQSGFTTYSSMTDSELRRHFDRIADDPLRWHRERLLVVARLGTKKFRLLQAATTLLIVALLVAVVAAVASAV